MSRRLIACYPGSDFPALSVTGTRCELNCDHCRGKYLRSMRAVTTPDQLFAAARAIQKKGGKGFLLSGGCRPDWTIPLEGFLDTIRRIKDEMDLEINVHTGALDPERASQLVDSGADVFSVDLTSDILPGNSRHLLPGFLAVTHLLNAGAARVVPHLCIGYPGIDFNTELGVLERISSLNIAAFVVLLFIPTSGTPLANAPSPADKRVIAFMSQARKCLSCSLILGCMRPRGRWELEVRCIQEGIDAIAIPSRRALRWAAECGYAVEVQERCCALYR